MPYYVYILECKNDRYYTGYTTDLERRYQEHVEGSPKCSLFYRDSLENLLYAADNAFEGDGGHGGD